ncbi:MAG: diaminopimelate decarboxylase [Chloroflexota bacterium]|nr:diaminopimelate decarboxylase [Chloroflexota bacterium]
MLNPSIHYVEGRLYVDAVPIEDIVKVTDTPVYIYSFPRVLHNLRRIQDAFADLNAHIHYSAKANANLALLKMLIHAGAGIDAVSAGEIYKALNAGCAPEQIVFAGVGKTNDELRFALDQKIGWFNVENVDELRTLNKLAGEAKTTARVALRFNPDVVASTIPQIATGHSNAKFGLNADIVRDLLTTRATYANVQIAGIHLHIGSQLGDIEASVRAVKLARSLVHPYPDIRVMNIGGGFPVAYRPDQKFPTPSDFAAALKPLLLGYELMLEPGRAIIADAGILVARILYVKRQGSARFAIVDAGMNDLIRPALYGAHHEIVAVSEKFESETILEYQVVGPVCESTDVLSKSAYLPAARAGDLVAALSAGAYGMVMASNYNARPRPPEVVVDPDGKTWRTVRRRETLEDLLAAEMV